MLYTDLTKRAMRIAFDAHKNQVDKSGLPYIFHPFHLAEQMTEEYAVCAALLHDVAEDTDITLEQMAEEFPEEVIAALEEKETEILTAKAYAATVIPEAQASALEIIESARSYSNRVSTVAKAESERFKSQLAAYRILPGMFKLNSKLEVLEQETAAIRKYIVGSGLEDEIYEMNFETRERIDLVDLDSSELSNQPAK